MLNRAFTEKRLAKVASYKFGTLFLWRGSVGVCVERGTCPGGSLTRHKRNQHKHLHIHAQVLLCIHTNRVGTHLHIYHKRLLSSRKVHSNRLSSFL